MSVVNSVCIFLTTIPSAGQITGGRLLIFFKSGSFIFFMFYNLSRNNWGWDTKNWSRIFLIIWVYTCSMSLKKSSQIRDWPDQNLIIIFVLHAYYLMKILIASCFQIKKMRTKKSKRIKKIMISWSPKIKNIKITTQFNSIKSNYLLISKNW